jgi:hypothetical protein
MQLPTAVAAEAGVVAAPGIATAMANAARPRSLSKLLLTDRRGG